MAERYTLQSTANTINAWTARTYSPLLEPGRCWPVVRRDASVNVRMYHVATSRTCSESSPLLYHTGRTSGADLVPK
jgi:hypothetical protein